MGVLCGGTKTPVRGAFIDDQLAKDKITVWGDRFSTETKTILAALEYCGIQYNYENIDSNLGDDFAYQSILSQSKELKELMSTQPEIGGANGGANSKMMSQL